MCDKMIVVVDDERTHPHALVHLRTGAEALAWLKSHDSCDELWLDHDLGGDDTTRPVVLWLCEQAFLGHRYKIDMIVVHSMNPVGAHWITSSLESIYPVRTGRLSVAD